MLDEKKIRQIQIILHTDNLLWKWYIVAYLLEPDWHNLRIYEPWSLLPYINMHFVYAKSVAWITREREHSYTMQINQ